MVETTKRCSTCGKEKSIQSFYRRTASSDGRASMCRVCQAEMTRNCLVRKKNPDSKPTRWVEGVRDLSLKINHPLLGQEIVTLWDEHPSLTMRTTNDIFYMAQKEPTLCPHLEEVFRKRGRRSILLAIRKTLEEYIPGVQISGTHGNPVFVKMPTGSESF